MSSPGRNAPCPCGSGKKYKKCCLLRDEDIRRRKYRTETLTEEELFESIPGEDPAEEFEDFSGEDVQEPESVKLNTPDLTMPEISARDRGIVDSWWEEFAPCYSERDADAMTERITSFMEEHPRLFPHLGLHEEALFELGGEIGERGEWARHADLLIRIRGEFPGMYLHSFGYYDRDIIFELALTGRRDEIPRYFSLFALYPGTSTQELFETANLLAAAGLDSELFRLVRETALSAWQSHGIEICDELTQWLAFEKYIPFLERRDCSNEAAAGLQKDLERLPITEYSHEIAGALSAAAKSKPAGWDISGCNSRNSVIAFYDSVSWAFCGYLHDNLELSWCSSRFLASLLGKFFIFIPEKKRPVKAFHISIDRLTRHIMLHFQEFGFVDGTRAISLLKAVWHFTDYLLENSIIDEVDKDINREFCMSALKICRGLADSTDPGKRMYENFPESAIPKKHAFNPEAAPP